MRVFIIGLLLFGSVPDLRAQEPETVLPDEEIDLDMDLDLNGAPPPPSMTAASVLEEMQRKAAFDSACERFRANIENASTDELEVHTDTLVSDLTPLIRGETFVPHDDFEARIREHFVDFCMPDCWRCNTAKVARFERAMAQARARPRDSLAVNEARALAFRFGRYRELEELKAMSLRGDPSPRVLRFFHHVAQRDGDIDGAIELLDRLILATDNEEQRADYQNHKSAILQQEVMWAQQKADAEEALAQDANHGPSMIRIGDYYSRFAGGGSIEAVAALWVAMDYYDLAAARDADIAEVARNRVSRYSRFIPCQDDVYFEGLRNGQGYTTPQGVRTTVRFREC
ncbi:MAG: hypothetical protein AAFQ53_11985 [Bacteroidota bacterium]